MNDLDILIANINALYKQEIDPSTKRFLGKKRKYSRFIRLF